MAGKAHVVIFVEGDTDKLLFDALMRYYRQQYGASIASCEVRNLHGVSRYMSKVSGKLRNQIIPAAEKKGMEVKAACCSYDTDVFEYAERPVVDWNRVEAEVKRMGVRNFCQVKVEQMIEDWLLDDMEGLCGYLKLKRRPAKLQGKNGYERLKSLYKAGGQVYVKGFGSEGLVAALDMGVIRQKRATALRQLEEMLGVHRINYAKSFKSE